MALIPCPECGKMISPNAVNCPHCGASVAQLKASSDAQPEQVPAPETPTPPEQAQAPETPIQPEATPKVLPCPECGKTVSVKATVCPHCGAPVAQILANPNMRKEAAPEPKPAPQPTPSPVPQQQSQTPPTVTTADSPVSAAKKSNPLPWIILAVVVVVAAIVLFLLLRKQDSSSAQAPQQATNTVNQKAIAANQEKTVSTTATFSVSASKQVIFSSGNLQYQPSSQDWRFAPHQYDIIGNGNRNISSSYSGWIDLFGWGTGDNPTKSSTDASDYYSFDDWGDVSTNGEWRTLSKSEWYYIFNGRTGARNKVAFATVEGNAGVIILPDVWNAPAGLSLQTTGSHYASNTLSASEWSRHEEAGALFLPAAGRRDGTNLFRTGVDGDYWSSSHHSDGRAYNVDFADGKITADDNSKTKQAFAVRLVHDIR